MNTPNILLVEDNEGDILLTQECLEDLIPGVSLEIARNGKQAIEIIEQKINNNDLPNLILLDINLPKINGLEVLKSLKENAICKHVPIIMLTTSSNKKDVQQAYLLQANSYLVKPIEIQSFQDALKMLIKYWFDVVQLPGVKKA